MVGNRIASYASGPPKANCSAPLSAGVVLALRGCKDRIHGGEDTSAIAFEVVESARSGKALQHALVHGMRIDAAGEIGEVRERSRPARLDDRLDGLLGRPL